MTNHPPTAATRDLQATRWAMIFGSLAVVAGNIVNTVRWRQSSLVGAVLSALSGMMLGGLMYAVLAMSNSARRRAARPLALFVAVATTSLDQMKAIAAWRDELVGTRPDFGARGFVSGSLMLTNRFLVWEPTQVHHYMVLTLPWTSIRAAVAADDHALPGNVVLEVSCLDGSEISFLTTGRQRLREALATVTKAVPPS